MHLAVLHLLLWDGCTAREHAQALIALATEQELPLWLGMATMLQGVALVEEGCLSGEQGKVQEGIAQARQGMVTYRATGAGMVGIEGIIHVGQHDRLAVPGRGSHCTK